MKRSARRRREQFTGIAALILVLLALLLVAILLPGNTTALENPDFSEKPPSPPEPNPYGPEDFAYIGDYLTCLSGRSIPGIDVSAHQQAIDFQAVAEAGIEFVMIRVGYRGYETGELVADKYAQRNYRNARAAGLQVGAYFFSQATSVREAQEEALFFLRAIQGWKLDMPAVYDWEYVSDDARTGGMTPRAVTDCSLAFCRAVASKGYQPMVYFNPHQARDFLLLEELTQYPFWLAMYTDRMEYAYKVDMWQYTDAGQVPGIEGPVDINLYFPEES